MLLEFYTGLHQPSTTSMYHCGCIIARLGVTSFSNLLKGSPESYLAFIDHIFHHLMSHQG